MTPTLVHIDSFIISGIKTRTDNNNELVPAQAKLPLLWGNFFNQNVPGKIKDKVEQSPVYGVYTNYDSDQRSTFDVIAGVKTTAAPKKEFVSTEIQGGNYLVFENKGQIPQIVMKTWLNVWNYFDEPQSITRLYTTDFEVYGKESVAIYIAVEPSYSSHH